MARRFDETLARGATARRSNAAIRKTYSKIAGMEFPARHHLCEIKYQQLIDRSVIKEMQKKVDVLEKAKFYSLRPVLIYAGELDRNSESDLREYFDQIISIEEIIG